MTTPEELNLLLGNPQVGPIDVFVSFSSQNRNEIKPIVSELRRRGLTVWWSDDLAEGRWDLQIRDSLNAARRVIAFVTEAAEASTRDYIFEEMEIARSQNKLIPAIVGLKPKSFALRGVIALVQSYFFNDFQSALRSEEFEKLVRTCGGRASTALQNNSHGGPIDRIDAWFGTIERRFSRADQVRAFSLAFAVALFEGAALAEVEDIGHRLSARLVEPISDQSQQPWEPFPDRSRPLLDLLECERTDEVHPLLGVTQSVVKFRDRDRAAAYMQFAWEEFGRKRDEISDWWRQIADQAPAEGRMRLGFALGILAQKHFIDLFDGVLKAWLLSESPGRRLVADIAISVAAFDPQTNAAIKKIISNWSEAGVDGELVVAIRLACGFVGARLPDVAIDTLRVAANRAHARSNFNMLDTMQDALNGLIRAHIDNSDNSLFDLPGLISRIADWVAVDTVAAESRENIFEQNAFPMALFLLMMSRVPLIRAGRARGRLSLDALVGVPSTADATAKVFAIALRRQSIGMLECRSMAKAILRDWIDKRSRSDFECSSPEQDPLLIFVRQLISVMPSVDEHELLVYMFDGVYAVDQLFPAGSRNF